MNQAEYFLANQVDGDLTTAQTMHMLGLPEGDTTANVESNVPDVATEVEQPKPEVAAAEPVVEAQPVILAKDGVHTIPFEKLTEARAAEQHWRDVAAEQARQLEALKTPPAAPAEEPTVETLAEEVDFGDYSDEEIRSGVNKLVAIKMAAAEEKFAAKLAAFQAPILKSQADAADDAHFSTIAKAHPDVETVVTGKEMNDWIEAQPSFNRPAMRAVIDSGTAKEVVELLDVFKAATGKLKAGEVKTDPVAVAQAAIAKAQAAPPTSLSEIPAGSTARADETEAMLELSGAALMAKFAGKTPEQTMALMSKLI